MCDSPTCACGDFTESFPDGKDLDASVAEAILRPYPELLAHWKTEVKGLVFGALRMYHSPTYLRCVVRQHLHLATGGDRIEQGLAARCEQIVSVRPDIAERRQRELNDPWWRALGAPLDYSDSIARYYAPEYLRSMVDYANKCDDPYSREGIHERMFIAQFRSATKDADAAYN